MTSEADFSILPPTNHTPRFCAYFDPPLTFNKNKQLSPPPPAYTAVAIPSTTNNAEYMTLFTDPATVFNELINQRSSTIIQRQLNSQEILRINQYIDNQEKSINARLVVVVCLCIFGIALEFSGIDLFLAYFNDLCGHYQTSSYCSPTYWALIVGCIAVFLGIVRIIIYCRMKAKITGVKKRWHEKIAQLQHN